MCFVFEKGKGTKALLLGKGHSVRNLQISTGAPMHAWRQSPLLPLLNIRAALLILSLDVEKSFMTFVENPRISCSSLFSLTTSVLF